MLHKSFQEILYGINNWINEESGWVTESIDAEFVNIFAFSLSYIEFPNKFLKKSIKGSINIKKNGNKYFLGCHIRL